MPMRTRFSPFTVLALCVVAAVTGLILYPLIKVLATTYFPGGRFDPASFRALVGAGLGDLVANTSIAVGSAVLVSIAVGSIFAWLIERTDVGFSLVGRLLPVLPLLLPPIAGAIGWVLLGAPRSGFVNAWTAGLLGHLDIQTSGPVIDIFSMPGLIFVYVIYLVPHVFLTVSAGLRNLDPSLEEASRISGAGPLRTLFHVTLPAVLPQIVSGGILALIAGLALFSLPLVIGGQAGIEILSVRIVHLMTAAYPPRTGEAMALGLLIVMVIGASWWFQKAILRNRAFATIGGKGSQPMRVRLGAMLWPARLVFAVYVLIASVLPLSALVIVSLQAFWSPTINFARLDLDNYRDLLGSPIVRKGLLNSLFLGISAATAGMLIAAVIVYWTDRNRGSRLSSAIDAITKLPAAVSHLVIAIAFIAAFAGAPFHLHGSVLILFLAYIVLYTPQSTLSAQAALIQVGTQLNEASLVSGAGQGRTFVHVTLPLMTPGLMAGWSVLFVLIAGDITASSMLASSRSPVAGFVILDLWSNGAFPPLAAFAVVITAALAFVVLVTQIISRRVR